jgi:hypothetical protein
LPSDPNTSGSGGRKDVVILDISQIITDREYIHRRLA